MIEQRNKNIDFPLDDLKKFLRSNTPLALFVTIAITFAVFLPIRGYGFSLVDDNENIIANPYLNNPLNQHIGYFWQHAYYLLYMPVTYTLWAWCARAFPLRLPIVVVPGSAPTYINPEVFHAVSLLLHTAIAGLVFAILRRLRFQPWGCAAGALLFALHPVQIQSVAWATGMNNLTGAFFGLLSLYLYLLHIYPADPPGLLAFGQSPSKQDSRSPFFSALLLSCATLTFAAALLSKSTATVIPIYAAALEALLFRRPFRSWYVVWFIWLTMAVACIVVTRITTGSDAAAIWSPLWARPFVVGDALAFYITKLVWPVPLSFDYVRNPRHIMNHWWGYVTWTLPTAIFAALWVWRQRSASKDILMRSFQRYIQTAVLLFVIGAAPCLGIIKFYTQWETTVNDRFMYLALLGPAFGLAALISFTSAFSRFIRFKLAIYSGVGIVLTALLCVTLLDLPVWTNIYSQTDEMLRTSPNSAMAHQCYGMLLYKRGHWQAARDEFEAAMRMAPNAIPTLNDSLALVDEQQGHFESAMRLFREALRLSPGDSTAWFQLMYLYNTLHLQKKQEAFVRDWLVKNPSDGPAQYTWGIILLQKNQPQQALPYLQEAIRNTPESSDQQYEVGWVLQKLGRFPEAEAYYRRAVDLDPTNADAATALSRIRHRQGE